MDTLQQSLNEAAVQIPALFLEKVISKKLQEQGITPAKGLSLKIAKHLLSGNTEPFVSKRTAKNRDISLTLTDADVEEVNQAVDRFSKNQLPALLHEMAGKISKKLLKDLKARWAEEDARQEVDLSGFSERLEERWGKPLGQLRMLLTMVREWCENAHRHESSRKRHKEKQLREILIRLLVRGCQVTDEIFCLLENGFADGAMARWRTLHEIAVVAAVVSQGGEALAERYIAHQAVESKRAMEKYLVCSNLLGYRPLSAGAQAKIVKAYDKAIARHGKSFKFDYGWAGPHLKKDKPTFADLEAAAGRAEMRSHYQMGNDNIHAGIKSMYVRLGLLDYDGLLAGRSNGGLTEPGQNAAHTLTQLAGIVCLSEGSLDDYVIGDMLTVLRNEIPRSFARAEARLRRDNKAYRNAQDPAGAQP
jgi:hypothetical protein